LERIAELVIRIRSNFALPLASVTLINSKSPDMKRNHFAIRRVILILLVCFISNIILAQKINLDTINIDQLNLYKDKAVKLRNAGRILSLGGICVTILGTGLLSGKPRDSPEFYVGASASISGIASTLVGIPLWAVGGSRMDVVEFTTLDFDMHNLYRDKAVRMRNIGRVMTLGGLVVSTTGIILFSKYANEDLEMAAAGLVAVTGIASAGIGIPIWAVGSSRKAKAELTLQKFKIAPGGSMAPGLGITIMF
jgi:hypothetical protein